MVKPGLEAQSKEVVHNLQYDADDAVIKRSLNCWIIWMSVWSYYKF